MCVKVSATFTSQLMSYHYAKMTQTSIFIGINGNLHFHKFGMVKLLKGLHCIVAVKSFVL